MLNLILSLVLGLLPYHVVAQNATCVSYTTYSWMYNSLVQSPCDIAAELGGVCTGGTFTVSALTDPADYYPGPAAAYATSCRCNTVYYSLIAACSTCQERTFVAFSSFTSECLTVYAQRFPEVIPEDTAVPHYAYLDISVDDRFNIANARAAGGPESTRLRSTLYAPSTISAPTSIIIPSTTILSTTIALTTSSTASSSSSSSTAVNAKNTNVGAIAGGVGGGIAGLAVLGVLVFLLLRRPGAPPTPPTSAHDPMMASQSPASLGVSPYPSSPVSLVPPSILPSNYPSPSTSPAPFGSPQLYPTQVLANYTGNTATSFTSGRPQYVGFPEP